METTGGPRWRNWLLLIFCSLSGLVALGGFFLLLAFGLISQIGVGSRASNGPMLVFLSWESLAVALLCLPIIFVSIRALQNKPVQPRENPNRLRYASFGLILWLVLVGLFYLLSKTNLSWVILPVIGGLATLLPIWWVVEFARRRLKQSPPERTWGLIGVSLTFTMPVVLLVSLAVLMVVVLLFIFYLSTQPELMAQLRIYAQIFSNPTADPQALLNSISGLIQQPAILFWVIVVVSGLIPLVEELLKTLAVWLFLGDRLTPADGFIAGLLCGASFAFVESFSALNSTAGATDNSGVVTLLVRVGTSLLHITTGGLVGWGIASAVQDRHKLIRLPLAYLGAVLLHGTWNATSILAGFGASSLFPSEISGGFQTVLTDVAAIVLVLLVPVLLGILSGFNRVLFRSQLPAVAEGPSPFENSQAEEPASDLPAEPPPGPPADNDLMDQGK